MPITPEQGREMMIRLGMVKGPGDDGSGQGVPAGEEIVSLHNPIKEWCDSQFPQVPYFYTRPDKASGSKPGTPDFALLYKGKVIIVECKTRDGKLSPEQLAFKVLAEMQGHTVHVVRDMEHFRSLVN